MHDRKAGWWSHRHALLLGSHAAAVGKPCGQPHSPEENGMLSAGRGYMGSCCVEQGGARDSLRLWRPFLSWMAQEGRGGGIWRGLEVV
jgi:hypothetical protein